MIVHFAMISFPLVMFILVVILLFSPGFFLAVFLDMSVFVAVMIFWYVYTFFMLSVFYFVTISPTACAGDLVLVFYVEEFFVFF